MKKGQITIFIIIGIIFITIILAFFLLKNKFPKVYQSDTAPIETYIRSCLEYSLIQSLRFFGIQGINYNNSEDFGNLSFVNIPYYYYEGENRMPSLEKIEKAVLPIYIEAYFEECNNLHYFKDFEIIETGNKDFLIVIKDKEVGISLKYPLKIVKGEKTYELEDFNSKIDFDFKKVYNIIYDFIEEQNKNPNYIPIGYIGIISNKNIIIEMVNIPEDVTIYVFKFLDIELSEEPYVYSFGIKYNWNDLKLGNKSIGL